MPAAPASIERYHLERELGAGAMGRVYLARDAKHGRLVALKTLHPEVAATIGAERFLQEIRIAAQLNHPHILALHDSGEVDGLLYYVMPYAAGETLRERLTRERRLSVDEALRLAREVADAMDHAHRHDVVHRDIKPENILLHEGHALVADFGIARALRRARGEGQGEGQGDGNGQPALAPLTEIGLSLGSPSYMSPEQAAGDPAVDGRSDIYSLGCVLYETLTGEPPFTGASATAIIAKRFTHDAPSVREQRPEVSEAVADAVARALAREPEARFQTARALGDALARAAHAAAAATAGPLAPRSGVAAEHSIVVLPFANLSSDPENEYFSDGLTEELIADLSRVKAVRVISRTSAMLLKGTAKNAREIGRELDVRWVLEGSVRKAGSSVRITAQLIDAPADSHVWAEKYTGTLDDIFALQERVSRDIVRGLDLTLSPAEDQALADCPIDDPTAYDCYLRARHEMRLFSPGALERTVTLVKRGMEIVGENALLRACLGQADVFRLRMGHSTDASLLGSAESHARAALASAPESGAGHHLMGLIEFERGHMQEAVRHLLLAARADPGDVDVLFVLGIVYLYHGRTDAARTVAARIASLDPLAPYSSIIASVAEWFDGRFADGIAPMARSLELTGESTLQRWQWAYLLALNGRVNDAAEQADLLSRRDPENPYTHQIVSLVKALRGDSAGALDAVASLEMDRLDHHTTFHVGECFAVAGDTTRAIEWLASGVEKGFAPYAFIERHNPFLAKVRGEPGFRRVLDEARRRAESFEENPA